MRQIQEIENQIKAFIDRKIVLSKLKRELESIMIYSPDPLLESQIELTNEKLRKLEIELDMLQDEKKRSII